MFLNRIKGLLQQSAFRLTLGLLFVFAIVTALAGVGTYLLVEREMNRMADARLTAQAVLIGDALQDGAPLPPPAFGQQYVVITNEGTIGSLPFAIPDRKDGTYVYDRRGPEFRYLVQTGSNGAQIIISENAERQDELLETLTGGLQVSILGTLLAGALAGLWFAVRGQKRVDLISRGLSQIASGDLDTRITLPKPNDDLSLLSHRINQTTERLSYVMDQMRVQSSNIAHDLRTPLARLRAGIETSLIDLTDRDQPVDADALGAALEQIDHIIGTFNALLRLSRVESGAGKAGFEVVQLDELCDHIAETFAPVIEDAGQSLTAEISNPEQINGDKDLLTQLVANLIQNALRYGADGQRITLQVNGYVLSVVDQGPGIPFAEREKVLQPLYQLEKTRQAEGFGLGLSMVAAIAELHGATLSLSDGHDGVGLSVTLRFPQLTKM